MTGVSGYVVVVSPGVRHLPELLSDTVRTLVHGDIITISGVREIFGLPVILTNINLIKQIKLIEMNNYDGFPSNKIKCTGWEIYLFHKNI